MDEATTLGTRTETIFPRSENDFYRTPMEAVEALSPHLQPGTRFCEPAAGAGDLVRQSFGHHCTLALDVFPQHPSIRKGDAMVLTRADLNGADLSITNLPFSWDVFVPLFWHLIGIAPMWNLVWAGFLCNERCEPMLNHAVEIIPTRRLKWIGDSRDQAKRDTVWVLFDAAHTSGPHLTPRRKTSRS